MLTLVLDTSTEYLFCALIVNPQRIEWLSHPAQKLHAELCVSTIETLCKKVDVLPKDITSIIVSIGPGSFTGVRIALTIAKVMGYALNIPVYPLSTLQMYASSYQEVLMTIPARGDRFYVGHYRDGQLIEDERIIHQDALQSWKQRHPTIPVSSAQTVLSNPKNMIEAIVHRKQTYQPINPIHHLHPVYFKEIG